MNRSFAQSLRLPLALAAAATLAACGGAVDFDVTHAIDVNSAVAAWSGEAAVDLSTANPDAWKQRKHIDSIEVVSAEATITSVPAASPTGAANSATTGTGTASFRPDGGGADVLIGSLSGPIVQGRVIPLTPSPAVTTFITDAMNGSGKFTVVASGLADGAPVSFTVQVHLACKLNWKLF